MTPVQMTLTCSRSKTPTCMLHTPPMSKFSSVSLHDEPFLSYGPIFGKVYRMTPNDLDMFKVKHTNMHATCTPRPKFSFVSLYDKQLSYGPIFGKVHCMTASRLGIHVLGNRRRSCVLIFLLLQGPVLTIPDRVTPKT